LGEEYNNEITGLISALILALSERMIFYSQYARAYTLVLFFFIAAAYCFVKIQNKESFNRWMPLFIIASGLCLWSHYYSAIPLAVLWAVLIGQYRKEIIPYLLIAVIPALAFILYIRTIIVEYLMYPVSVIYPPSAFNVTWIDNLFRVPYECWGYLALILIPLFIFYLWKSRNGVTFYFALSAGITWFSTIILTLVFDPSARYAVLIAPLIIVPAIVPVTEFIQRNGLIRRIAVSIGVIYVILMANIFPLIAWYTTTNHFVFV
jgi:uncharacterized membrane protein